MQIVIDITSDAYEFIKDVDSENYAITQEIYKAVYKGTPLPGHHGRLIDADAYIKSREECGWLDQITVDEFNEITPTIIEAESEKEDFDNLDSMLEDLWDDYDKGVEE